MAPNNGRRLHDRRRSVRVAAWVDRLVTMIAVGIAAYSVYLVTVERTARADQLCTISEGKQAKDVEQLRSTYRFLLDEQRRGRLGEGINPAILAQLPKIEEDAYTDDAPAFCDVDGVGLPEPDQVVPSRPRSLRPPDVGHP